MACTMHLFPVLKPNQPILFNLEIINAILETLLQLTSHRDHVSMLSQNIPRDIPAFGPRTSRGILDFFEYRDY